MVEICGREGREESGFVGGGGGESVEGDTSHSYDVRRIRTELEKRTRIRSRGSGSRRRNDTGGTTGEEAIVGRAKVSEGSCAIGVGITHEDDEKPRRQSSP